MNGIASSLEQEFAERSNAERESNIAELKKIDADGRGSVDVASHMIVLPALIGLIACGLIYSTLTRHDLTTTRIVTTLVCSVAVAALCAWTLFGPRKPRFTLTEEGVRVKDAMLPWSSIEDYGVTEHSTNGFTTHTSIVLQHAAGFTPPKLGVFYPLGASARDRKTDQYETRLTLFVGAKGMNVEKLAQRIGQYLAASHARAELQRLGA